VETAFANLEALAGTLEQLSENGAHKSLGLSAYRFPPVVHEAASWIWSAGGDFLDVEGKRAIFDQPPAMRGLRQLFSLARFLVPPSSPPRTPVAQILDGDAAVAIDGPYYALCQQRLPPAEQLGIVPVPGVPCLGGTSLIIWKHSRQSRAALELVRFLSQHVPQAIRLSARLQALRALAEQSTLHDVALTSLKRGRTFPAVRLWGAIEERLIDELAAIWLEVLAGPAADIDTILYRRLDPLARRVNLMLMGSSYAS
jgi:ABC-type glycerol-3-phosphate transport system substrate-binding protein